MINKKIKKNMALITAISICATLSFSNTKAYAKGPCVFPYVQDGTSTIGYQYEATSTQGYCGEGTNTQGYYGEGTSTQGYYGEGTSTQGYCGEGTSTAERFKEDINTNVRRFGESEISKSYDIKVDKTIVKSGDVVKVTLKSKNNNYVQATSINLSYQYRFFTIHVVLKKQQDGTFIGELNMPSDARNGLYAVSAAYIFDVNGNTLFKEENKPFIKYEEMENLYPNGSVGVINIVDGKITQPIPETKKAEDIIVGMFGSFELARDYAQSNVQITLDNKIYDGSLVDSIGRHSYIFTDIGSDGTKTSQELQVNVDGEITSTSTPGEVVQQLKSSDCVSLDFDVNKDVKSIDKSIFKEIKGKARYITFKKVDGAEWIFDGRDITDDTNIQDVDLTVSTEDKQNSGVKDKISKITKDAQLIQFDYHGTLPSLARVTINVGKDNKLKGKCLTLYYYNSLTDKAEMVQDYLIINEDGDITIDVTHCSDYFLSTDPNLDLTKPKVERSEITNKETSSTVDIENPTNTGDYSTNVILILAMMLLASGALVLNKKSSRKNN